MGIQRDMGAKVKAQCRAPHSVTLRNALHHCLTGSLHGLTDGMQGCMAIWQQEEGPPNHSMSELTWAHQDALPSVCGSLFLGREGPGPIAAGTDNGLKNLCTAGYADGRGHLQQGRRMLAASSEARMEFLRGATPQNVTNQCTGLFHGAQPKGLC